MCTKEPNVNIIIVNHDRKERDDIMTKFDEVHKKTMESLDDLIKKIKR